MESKQKVTDLEIDFWGPKDNQYDRADEQSYLPQVCGDHRVASIYFQVYILCRSPEGDITSICFITIQFLV